MRTPPFVVFAAVFVACAEPAPPPASPSAPPLVPSIASAPGSAAASAAPVPPPVTSDPTTLTGADRSRDAAREPLARALVDAYPNWNGFFSSTVAEWSPDQKHFLFGSTRDGVPEIYAGEEGAPDATPVAITKGPERAIWAKYTVDGKAILFLRDHAGNENHHIYRANTDGSNAVDLTPEEMHRDEPLLPKKKPDTMIYSAARVTAPDSMLFTQSTSGGPARLVFTAHRSGGASDVTQDGARVLFYDSGSPADTVITEIEIATGKARRVYPPEGKKAAVSTAAYSADEKRIFIATDEGAESSVLLALDAKTGKELGRYVNESPKTGALSVVVAPKGDVLAALVDAGNHGEVRILSARTLKPIRDVTVPLGDIHIGSFRADGKEFSILISEPDHPADPFAVDVATGTVKPLRADKRAGLDVLAKVDVTIDKVPAFDGLTIPVNRYLPRDKANQKLPTIAIFHGGPSTSYAVRWSPFARFFVSLGYAVIEPNVRGSTGFGRAYEAADNREKRADWLKDLASVNTWAKSQPWCDPARVIVWGQSYGGYTTLMALTRQPASWRAGVDLYGVADLKQFLRTTDAGIRSYFVEEFGDLDRDSALLDAFNPMRDVDKIVSPLFVYAGQNDPRVPRAESDTVVRALRARQIHVEYMVAANEGHTVDRRETKIELLTRTARFLEDATR